MKTIKKLADEVPVTKEGLKIYINGMEKEFSSVSQKYSRMKNLLQIANERLDHMLKFNKEAL